MYFSDAIGVLLRRWYVVVVGLLLVAGGVAAALVLVPTQYQATAHVLLLLPSQSTGVRNPTNPYLNLQPGLTTTATLIASELGTKSAQRTVAEGGFDSSFAVGVAPDTGPLFVITVEDTDPAMAVATREEVVRQLDVQLSTMQNDMDVPSTQVIFARRNDPPGGAEVLPGSKIRAAAGIVGLGVALTVVAAFLVDRLARRRASRRQAEDPSSGGADPEVPAVPAPVELEPVEPEPVEPEPVELEPVELEPDRGPAPPALSIRKPVNQRVREPRPQGGQGARGHR
ncbi:MAG: hypothetical protein ABIQ15_12275 [Nocardioides sp.]